MGERTARILGFWNEDWSLRFFLWMTIFVIFVVTPLDVGSLFTSLVVRGTTLVAFVFGVFTVTERPWLRFLGLTCVACASGVGVLLEFRATPSLEATHAFISAAFSFAFAGMVLHQVFRDGAINWHRIEGAIAVYLMLGLGFAWAYEAIESLSGGAFALPHPMAEGRRASLQLVYFSFVTLTTVGYGDVVALHPMARSLALLEALVGQLYPAILLARLVSLEVASRDRA